MKPGDFATLDRIATPGKDAHQALSDIRAEAYSIFPGIRDADWAAIQTAILTSDPSRARADLVQDMLRLAVAAGTVDRIELELASIECDGTFDRSLTAPIDVRSATNLHLFDPHSAVGLRLWECVGKLLTALFSRSGNHSGDQHAATVAHASLRTNDFPSMSTFLSSENNRYGDLKIAKVSYSDYTRIGLVLDSMLTSGQKSAYESHRRTMKEMGQWTDLHDNEFSVFAGDLERVVNAMPQVDTSAPAAPASAPAPVFALAPANAPTQAPAPGHSHSGRKKGRARTERSRRRIGSLDSMSSTT